MKLSKFFRRYSRVLILVVMGLLAIIFVIGDAVGRRGGGGTGGPDIEYGSAFGQQIRMSDIGRAEADLNIASRLGFQPVVPGASDTEVGLNFLLLSREADRMGIQVGREQVIKTLQVRNVPSDVVAEVRDSTQRSLASVYAAVGRYLAVEQAARLQMAAIHESAPRIELTYRDVEEVVDVKMSVLDARAFVDDVAAPTDEQIQGQFATYRETSAKPSTDDFGFGYLLQPRVEIEYLTVDPVAVLETVRVREKEVQDFFRTHRDSYVRFVPVENRGPSDPPVRREFREYDEVRDEVRRDTRLAKATEEAQRLVNTVRRELNAPWLAQPRDSAGYHEQPSKDAIRDLQQVAEQYSTTYPVQYVREPLMSASELAAQPGIGRAFTSFAQQRLTVPALALRVKGLYTPAENELAPVLNLYEPSPVVIDVRRGRVPSQAYVFRVVQAVPAGPAQLADVREKVVADLKLKAAYEVAGEWARKLEASAAEVGLADAVAQADALKSRLDTTDQATASAPAVTDRTRYVQALGPFSPARLTRQPGFIQFVDPQFAQKVRDAIFDAIAAGKTDDVLVVAMPGDFKWVVVQINEVRPLYAGQLELQRSAVADQNRSVEQQAFIQNWFNPDNIRQRANFERIEPEQA